LTGAAAMLQFIKQQYLDGSGGNVEGLSLVARKSNELKE
jgi:hypothetical protein